MNFTLLYKQTQTLHDKRLCDDECNGRNYVDETRGRRWLQSADNSNSTGDTTSQRDSQKIGIGRPTNRQKN